MRGFGGLHYAYSNGPWNFNPVDAIPTRGVFQANGCGWVKTPLACVPLIRESAFGFGHAESGTFGIYYNDGRSIPKTGNRLPAVRNQDFVALACTAKYDATKRDRM